MTRFIYPARIDPVGPLPAPPGALPIGWLQQNHEQPRKRAFSESALAFVAVPAVALSIGWLQQAPIPVAKAKRSIDDGAAYVQQNVAPLVVPSTGWISETPEPARRRVALDATQAAFVTPITSAVATVAWGWQLQTQGLLSRKALPPGDPSPFVPPPAASHAASALTLEAEPPWVAVTPPTRYTVSTLLTRYTISTPPTRYTISAGFQTMPQLRDFPNMEVGSSRTLGWDFAAQLPSGVTLDPTQPPSITVSVLYGSDPSPQSRLVTTPVIGTVQTQDGGSGLANMAVMVRFNPSPTNGQVTFLFKVVAVATNGDTAEAWNHITAIVPA